MSASVHVLLMYMIWLVVHCIVTMTCSFALCATAQLPASRETQVPYCHNSAKWTTAKSSCACTCGTYVSEKQLQNRQQRNLAVCTSKCNKTSRSTGFFWPKLRASSTGNQLVMYACLTSLLVKFRLFDLCFTVCEAQTFCIACTAYTFYTGCSLMSLMLPCYSDFDLLAGPAAVDMSVICKLCHAMHLYA